MFLEIFSNSNLIENLAWTLLHSVWQIAAVAFYLFLALRLFSKANANLRYLFAVSVLALSLILPIATFFYVSQNSISANNNQIIAAKLSEKPELRTQNSEEIFRKFR